VRESINVVGVSTAHEGLGVVDRRGTRPTAEVLHHKGRGDRSCECPRLSRRSRRNENDRLALGDDLRSLELSPPNAVAGPQAVSSYRTR
jgi:hypothetical protein